MLQNGGYEAIMGESNPGQFDGASQAAFMQQSQPQTHMSPQQMSTQMSPTLSQMSHKVEFTVSAHFQIEKWRLIKSRFPDSK